MASTIENKISKSYHRCHTVIKENNIFVMHEYKYSLFFLSSKYSSINFEFFLISILSKTRSFMINHNMRDIYFRSDNKDIYNFTKRKESLFNSYKIQRAVLCCCVK